METRASPFAVGLFTLAVLAGVLIFVFWLGRYGEATGREEYRVVFSDEVTGLSRGSAVLYSGIRVGEVTALSISAEDPSEIVALIQVDQAAPMRADTRAQLQYQGITGVAYIQLRAGTTDPRPLREAWAERPGAPVIHAERSAFQDLMEGGQNLLAKLDSVADRVDRLVSDNEAAIAATVRNVETFTGALAENSDEVATFLSDAGAAARRLDTVGARLETLAENLDNVVSAVDPDAVRSVVSDVQTFAGRLDDVALRVARLVEDNEAAISNTVRNAETFTTALAENSEAISSFMADAATAAQRLDSAGERIEALAARAEEVVAAVEPDAVRAIVADAQTFSQTLAANSQQITAFAENAGSAAERLNRLAGDLEGVGENVARVVAAVDPNRVARSLENVETFTSSLAARSEDFDQFMDDAGAVASQLRQTSQRLDDLLVRVDGMVADDGEGFIADIAAAARSFRQLTENLDSRLDVIMADVQRYGGGGLRDFQAFMSEGRRTLTNIERVLNSLERDPSRLIFGGSRSPEYNPGRRF